MGFAAFASILVVALLVGIAVQYFEQRMGWDWLVIAAAGTFGGYFASEYFPGSTVFSYITNWGPEFDGMYIVPAAITGLVLALIGFVGTRIVQPAPSTA